MSRVELPTLPDCRHRGPHHMPDRFACASPRVRAPHGVRPRDCAGCELREAHAAMEWVSTSRLIRDAMILAGMLPPDVVGIVGIPRSGLIPAATAATLLHVPLYELTRDGPRLLSMGSRGYYLDETRPGRLAVIDDTVYGGTAMTAARKYLAGKPAVYCAVYVRPEVRAVVDLFVRELPSPHILEWNFANNGPFAGYAKNPIYGRGIACDFDGILCHDAQSGGPIGLPYLLPRMHPVRLIATGRHELHRGVTEEWLRYWGVRWERLEMLPDGVQASIESIAAFKAKHYLASGCGFFVESEPLQAEKIHAATGKPVICPALEKVFHDPRPTTQRPTIKLTPRPAPHPGPGTELMSLLKSLGVKTCGACAEYAQKMNEWGVEGCRQRRAEIVERLRNEQQKRGWAATLFAAAGAVAIGLATRINPLDPLGSLVDEAIRRAGGGIVRRRKMKVKEAEERGLGGRQ